jgi:hypothetical protein
LLKRNHAKESTSIYLDGAPPNSNTGIHAGQRRWHNATEQDMKCDASTLQLQATLKGLYAKKEVSNEKREEINARTRRN